MIYANKIENRITFTIKIRYHFELLTPKTIKLLECTKCKITKNENVENVPHLEINEVVLMIVILSTGIISKIQESCIHLFRINHLVNYQIFHPRILYF